MCSLLKYVKSVVKCLSDPPPPGKAGEPGLSTYSCFSYSSSSLSIQLCKATYLMTNAISAGILPGILSPSLAKVTLVPAFHPGLTLIWRTFSSTRLSPVFSSYTRLEIFIFFTTPLAMSSRLTGRSRSIVAS